MDQLLIPLEGDHSSEVAAWQGVACVMPAVRPVAEEMQKHCRMEPEQASVERKLVLGVQAFLEVWLVVVIQLCLVLPEGHLA